ncbi:MAG: biotin--[acetyl-CoA-carboxylase] ligase [Jatrophihabitans sp.]
MATESTPERSALHVAAVRDALRAAGVSWTVDVVAESASTNAELLVRAAGGAAEGTVLTAEFQSAGRGRLDRTWTSPSRAGLTASVLLRPAVPLTAWGWLPLLAGVALCDAVGEAAAMKWPNDLVLGAQAGKAAGILVQAEGGAAVVGIGVNVSLTADELPTAQATSLLLEDGVAPNRTELLGRLLVNLAARYVAWVEADGDPDGSGIRAAYVARCRTIGQQVRVTGDALGEIVGRATGIDPAGRLLLATDEGPRAISAGDITHLRPADR